MKLQEAKDAYYESTATLSELTRKLVYVGVGIIWILRVGGNQAGGLVFDKKLLVPLALFILSIVLDVLQYAYKSVAWLIYYEIKHRGGLSDEDIIDPSDSLNVPAYIFFVTKVFSGFAAFVILLARISEQLVK